MMTEVNAAEFPNELIDVGFVGEVRQPLCLENELTQLLSPTLFKLSCVGAHLTFNVVQFK